jgi:uncharacterized damage-inducible protein DinB
MHARELLVQPIAHIAPARAIEGLSVQHAHRRVHGGPHSIAEIVAHMAFWQEWFIDRCIGVHAPIAAKAAAGWPDVTDGSWPDLEQRFVHGLERAVALGEPESRLDAPVAPAIEFPPLSHYTVRDALTHMAQHNAHHLGQVIVLRQVLGTWPPPAGSYTW